MNSSFFHSTSFVFSLFFLLILFVCIFFIPFSSLYPESFGISTSFFPISTEYVWPIPGYSKITSPFGKRTSPTAGASSYHKGIDIGAPEGTKLYAITSGSITFADFLGGGGYTLTLSTEEEMKITYCHVSPNFLVRVGDVLEKGALIATVGPMYVSDVPNNPYTDKNGNPTNGAITGCHLHLGIRVQEEYMDPLTLFD